MPGLAQCGRCKAWFDTFAGHRCGFLPYQDSDMWKAGPVSPPGTLPLVDTGKIADLLKDREIARLRAQLDEAVGLIKDVLGSIEGSPNPTELWYEVRSQLGRYKQALNRLDAGEGGE